MLFVYPTIAVDCGSFTITSVVFVEVSRCARQTKLNGAMIERWCWFQVSLGAAGTNPARSSEPVRIASISVDMGSDVRVGRIVCGKGRKPPDHPGVATNSATKEAHQLLRGSLRSYAAN